MNDHEPYGLIRFGESNSGTGESSEYTICDGRQHYRFYSSLGFDDLFIVSPCDQSCKNGNSKPINISDVWESKVRERILLENEGVQPRNTPVSEKTKLAPTPVYFGLSFTDEIERAGIVVSVCYKGQHYRATLNISGLGLDFAFFCLGDCDESCKPSALDYNQVPTEITPFVAVSLKHRDKSSA